MSRGRVLTGLVLIAVSGCTDEVDLAAFDAVGLDQKTSAALAAVENNAAARSLGVLSSAFTFAAAPPVREGGTALAGIATEPSAVLPATVLGKTYAYNEGSGRYASTAQSGAPANGVRFLLYAVDVAQQRVRSPLEQIGYLEMLDKSSSGSNTLGVKALIGDATTIEYDATASASGSSISLSARGYVGSGGTRMEFDLSNMASIASGLRLEISASAPAQGVTLRLVGTAPSGIVVQKITFTLTEGVNQSEISAEGDQLTGTVKYNGKTLATIGGTASTPSFTAQNGRVLTSADLAALGALFAASNRLFEGFDNVLGPAYRVFFSTS